MKNAIQTDVYLASILLLFLQVVILPLAFIEYLAPADEHFFGSTTHWTKLE